MRERRRSDERAGSVTLSAEFSDDRLHLLDAVLNSLFVVRLDAPLVHSQRIIREVGKK